MAFDTKQGKELAKSFEPYRCDGLNCCAGACQCCTPTSTI